MREYEKLMSEIRLIKKAIYSIERNTAPIGGWIPKNAAMRFLDYADNQMRVLERKNLLIVSKIGRRKFYSIQSLIELIQTNQL